MEYYFSINHSLKKNNKNYMIIKKNRPVHAISQSLFVASLSLSLLSLTKPLDFDLQADDLATISIQIHH